MSTTEALQREAFDNLHPKNDEVPGVLRESFFFLFSKGWEAAALAAAAPSQKPVDPLMLRHLIYAAIVHEGKIESHADHEAAADRVIDMLQRGGHLAEAPSPAAEPATPGLKRHALEAAEALSKYAAAPFFPDTEKRGLVRSTTVEWWDGLAEHIESAQLLIGRALHELSSFTPGAHPAPTAQPAPESLAVLLKFYGVASVNELIEAQARHIERLQAKLPHGPSFAPQQVRED